MTIKLDPISGRLLLTFQYSKPMVDAIKDLPDRVYDPTMRQWSVGYTNDTLKGIFDVLAHWFVLVDTSYLNSLEAQCRALLVTEKNSESLSVNLPPAIRSPLMLAGVLIVEAYTSGRITQNEQSAILEIFNHLSIKDFVR